MLRGGIVPLVLAPFILFRFPRFSWRIHLWVKLRQKYQSVLSSVGHLFGFHYDALFYKFSSNTLLLLVGSFVTTEPIWDVLVISRMGLIMWLAVKNRIHSLRFSSWSGKDGASCFVCSCLAESSPLVTSFFPPFHLRLVETWVFSLPNLFNSLH